MNEPNVLNALIREVRNLVAVLDSTTAAEQAKKAAIERADEIKKRTEEAKKIATEIEKLGKIKAETTANEAKLLDDDKDRLRETISLFDDLERQGVLSYRVEPPLEGKPCVLKFRVKNGQPIIITISSSKVGFEKVQPDGSRESVTVSGISKASQLSKDKMLKLINELLQK